MLKKLESKIRQILFTEETITIRPTVEKTLKIFVVLSIILTLITSGSVLKGLAFSLKYGFIFLMFLIIYAFALNTVEAIKRVKK